MFECPHCYQEIQLTDEQLASQDSYELVANIRSDLYKTILNAIRTYERRIGTDPDYKELTAFIYMCTNKQYNPITISSRLSELRRLGFVTSYKVEGKRSTTNVVTDAGTLWLIDPASVKVTVEKVKKKYKNSIKAEPEMTDDEINELISEVG